MDPEYIALIQDIFARPIPGHLYRGYTILDEEAKQETEVTENRLVFIHILLKGFSITKEVKDSCGLSTRAWEVSGLEWRET